MSLQQDIDDPKTTKIEVYNLSSDCESVELEMHFESEPFCARYHRIKRRGKSFIVELLVQDAEKVLAEPEQFLYGDEKKKFCVRQFAVRTILVSAAKTLPDQLLKHHFSTKFGAVESCHARPRGKQSIVTFTNAEDAVKAVKETTHSVTSNVSIRVELYDETAQSYGENTPSIQDSDDMNSLGSAAFVSLETPRPTTRRLKPSHRAGSGGSSTPTLVTPIPIKPLTMLGDMPLLGTRMAPSVTPLPGSRVGPVTPLPSSRVGPSATPTAMEPNSPHPGGKRPLKFDSLRHDGFSPFQPCQSIQPSQTDQLSQTLPLSQTFRPVSGNFKDFSTTRTSLPSQPLKNTLLVETSMSMSVLKKYMQTKSKGTLSKKLSEGKFLVEYETDEAAKRVADQKVLKFSDNNIKVSFYDCKDDADKTTSEESDSLKPTHIEVKKLTKMSATEMHGLLTLHLDDKLGYEGHTPYKQSYDDIKHLFRFDLRPQEITKLMTSPQLLEVGDESYELILSSSTTGKHVIVRARKSGSSALTPAHLKDAFGPSSAFSSAIGIVPSHNNCYELTLDSSSVAAKIVTRHQYKLKNGAIIEASFPDTYTHCEGELSTDEDGEDGETDAVTDEAEGNDVDKATDNAANEETAKNKAANKEKITDNTDNEATATDKSANEEKATDGEVNEGTNAETDVSTNPTNARHSALTTLLVSNILDFDEQTLYFWVKSALHVWPHSIQVSANEEEAIVKVPTSSQLDERIRVAQSHEDCHLHGGLLNIKELSPSICVQVICEPDVPGVTIEADTIEAYFSNERYTGVKNSLSLQSVEEKTTYNNLPVYVVTYSTSQDVECVVGSPHHRHNKWTFHVAEFHADVGVCPPKSLSVYKMVPREVRGQERTPVLHIMGVGDIDTDNLKLLMGHRRRTDGGEIDRYWTSCMTGSTTAHIVYKNADVAERVYNFSREEGIKFGDTYLDLQLELPWLTDAHDDHKVQVSGLHTNIDPEKLRCYLSALAGDVVTELLFDERLTKAVATFRHSLVSEYGKLVNRQSSIPLKGFQDLKLSQAEKSRDLVATGKLYKEQIELQLEDYLSRIFDREVEVFADEFPGTTDMWRITTEHAAISHVLTCDKFVKQCESIRSYSQFLGLHVTNGAVKKTENLSNLVTDPILVSFLLRVRTGYESLGEHLRQLGMHFHDDGTITTKPGSSRQDDRVALKNWRSLKPSLERFISEKLQVYKTEALTQQIYERVAAEVPRLVADLPLVTATNTAGQSTGNVISVVGERVAVEGLKVQLLQLISRFEMEIREEQREIKVTIPNVLDFQISYLQSMHLLDGIKRNHGLTSISYDTTIKAIVIEGLPRLIDAAQTEMLKLLRKITDSKVSVNRKAAFLKVLKTDSAGEAIRQEFQANSLSALWVVENRTLSVFAESKKASSAAMECIDSVVWEDHYPAGQGFDELERSLLQSDMWRQQLTNMQQLYQPLEISELEKHPRLVMAGLKPFKVNVLEDISHFFERNVERKLTFNGVPDRILFLSKRCREVRRELEVKHHVSLRNADGDSNIEICGTKRAIADCKSELQDIHDSICMEVYDIDNAAMIQHITEDYDVLETVGLKSHCVVVPHNEEVFFPSSHNQEESMGVRCSLRLSTGSQCLVRRGDITAMSCDVIVNAANGDLQHVGGLALAIVRKGGSSIQQECIDHVRRNGQLMEGQVFTSSAGSLKCKKIIHAVGPRWSQGRNQEERTLYTCVDNCFDEVDRLKLQSIAIPPISTGIFAYPLEQAVATIVEAMHERDRRGDALPQQIIFIDNKEDSLRLFEKELMKRYKSPQLGAVLSTSRQANTAAVTAISAGYTINRRTISAAGGIDIEIQHADISTCQVDSIVSSVGQDMDLSVGKASKAISTKAGPQLQGACKALAPIREGETKETNGFNLPCKTVLHCRCPPWNNAQCVQHLKKIVTNCLKHAVSLRYQSIAFPALGTGNLSYPVKEVAKGMIEAVMEYSSRHPRVSLKCVNIVIFPNNNPVVQGFDNELRRLSGNAGSTSGTGSVSGAVTKRDLRPDSMSSALVQRDLLPQAASTVAGGIKGLVTVNNTTIRVLQGDITNHKSDAIVNSTDSRLSMNGILAKALMAKAGQIVQDEVYAMSLSSEQPKDGIWVSSGGELKAKYLLHINSNLAQRSADKWAKLISGCLKHCERLKLRTIALPAVGTGNLGNPANQMAVTISKAVVTYLNEHSKSCLTGVDIVIFQSDMVQDFVVSMEKTFEKHDSWWARLKVKVSKWRASRHAATADGNSLMESASTSPPQGTARLQFDIYGNSTEAICQCKAELQKSLHKVMVTLIWSETPGYKEERTFISKLSTRQTSKLQLEANQLNVTLDIDTRLHNIRIAGLQKSVTAMSHSVSYELKTVERKIHEKKEESLVAKTTEWWYEDENGAWVKFDPGVNKALEEVYEINPQGTHSYKAMQGEVTFNLGNLTGVDSSNKTFKIQRKDLYQQQAVVVPKSWLQPHDTYQECQLVPTSPEYQAVEQDFKAGGAGNTILQIKRVQNSTLYLQYAILRKDVAKRLGKTEDQVERTPLWHGTSEDTVSKITNGKFDRGLSGANGTSHGHGSYFATTSSYSVGYARANTQGHKYMIKARVVVGDFCQGQGNMKAAPYKPNSNVIQYDSVVNNPNNPTMFIVFHDASAYPEYIIKFQ